MIHHEYYGSTVKLLNSNAFNAVFLRCGKRVVEEQGEGVVGGMNIVQYGLLRMQTSKGMELK
jgi:hypothetical protein